MTRVWSVLVLVAVVAACTRQQTATADSPVTAREMDTGLNQLTEAERAQGWRLLFDGKSLEGWRVYRGQSQPGGWTADQGLLTKHQVTDDIISTGQYADFELQFEWRVSEGGNAGVFYRATEEYEKVYWTGTEYQLLDDANHPDGRNRLTSAGANYGLYPAPPGVVKPAGQWNSSRILVRGNHAEHWLNGVKLLEYEYGGADWKAKVAASKFAEWPAYGRAARGHIAIQGDHTGTLALRNIKLRPL